MYPRDRSALTVFSAMHGIQVVKSMHMKIYIYIHFGDMSAGHYATNNYIYRTCSHGTVQSVIYWIAIFIAPTITLLSR